MNKKTVILIISLALMIKLALYFVCIFYAPESKFLPDSGDYLSNGKMLYTQGKFLRVFADGDARPEMLRTPGYPFFLAVFHYALNIPLEGIILIQIMLTVLVAFITYKVAVSIKPELGILSAVIVLYDLPVASFSMTILTETLFLFLLAVFMLEFVRYLKDTRITPLVLSAILLALATYVRPISYYLGAGMALFVLYAKFSLGFRRAAWHAALFFLTVYFILGLWQIRNHHLYPYWNFSSVSSQNYGAFGIIHSYAREGKGVNPVLFYIQTFWDCLVSIMTRPGSLKYLRVPLLTVISKVFGYPWMVLWLAGFVVGIFKVGRNIYFQFMLFVTVYFILVSIGGVAWLATDRFRVPIVPFIAVISALGWVYILKLKKRSLQSS